MPAICSRSRTRSGSDRAPALAVSMARPRQLEGRMLAVLDAARNRRVPVVARAHRGGGARGRVAASAGERDVDRRRGGSRTPDGTAGSAAPQQDPVSISDLKALKAHHGRIRPRVVRARRSRRPHPCRTGCPARGKSVRPSTEGTVHLRLVELNSSSGSNIPIERLEGLTAAQLTARADRFSSGCGATPGTFTFEGVFRSGVGAGTFSFTPDPNFPAELAKRGFARPTAREQYQMARHDIGFAFLDELTKQGYAKPQTSRARSRRSARRARHLSARDGRARLPARIAASH